MNRPEIMQKGDRVVICQTTRKGRRQTIELDADQIDDVVEELEKARGARANTRSEESDFDPESERQDSFGRL